MFALDCIIIVLAAMQIEDLDIPSRKVRKNKDLSSNSEDDGNLFNQPSQKSQTPKKQGKLKKKKPFLMRCMNDDSDKSSQKQEKPKRGRLLFKTKFNEDKPNEDSFSHKGQSEVESSQKISDQKSESQKQSANDSDLQAMKLFQGDGNFIEYDMKKPKKQKKPPKQKQVKQKLKKVTKKELMKIKNEENWKQWDQMFNKQSSSQDDKSQNNEKPREYFTGMEFQKEKKILSRMSRMFRQDELLEGYHQQFVEDEPKEFPRLLRPQDEQQVVYTNTILQSLHPEPVHNAEKNAKDSLTKLILTSNISDDVELDLKISLPSLVKGKSNHVTNNTLFLKKLSFQGSSSKPYQQLSFINTMSSRSISTTNNIVSKKKTMTRAELFSSISKDIKLRKSKTVSLEEIRHSFKTTDLNQLQEQRNQKEKKLQELDKFEDDSSDSDFKEEEKDEQSDQVKQNVIIDTNGRVIRLQTQGEDKKQPNPTAKNYTRNFQNNGFTFDKKEVGDEENDQNYMEGNGEDLEEQQVQMQVQEEVQEEEDYNDEIINNPIDDEEYRRLLRLDDDNQQDEQQEEQQQEEEEEEQMEEQQEIEADNEEQQDKDYEVKPHQQLQNQGHRGKSKFQIEDFSDQDQNQIQQKYIKDDQQNQQKEQLRQYNQKLNQRNTFEVIEQAPEQEQESKKIFNRLRKMAVVISERKKKREQGKKVAQAYFDDEAELGSDNEDNDQIRKQINRKQQLDEQNQLGDNLDGQLEGLIDNAVYLNDSDQDFAFQKFMEDQRLREKEQLSRVIQGKFKVNNIQNDRFQFGDADELDREKRLNDVYEQMRRRDEEQDAFYMYNKLAEGEKKSKNNSESENEQYENNIFYQELKRQQDRQKARKIKVPEPMMIKKIRQSKEKQSIISSNNLLDDRKFKINVHVPLGNKRGSLMMGEIAQINSSQRSELSKLYTKDVSFFTPSKTFLYANNNQKNEKEKVSKPRKPKQLNIRAQHQLVQPSPQDAPEQ